MATRAAGRVCAAASANLAARRRAACAGPYPFETRSPVRARVSSSAAASELVRASGATSGPWLAFAPIFQITHIADAQGDGAVPVAALSRRDDGRPRQRPLRPAARGRTPTASTLTTTTSSPCSMRSGSTASRVVGISATAMTALRLAAEQPAARDAPDRRRRLRRFADADRCRLAKRLAMPNASCMRKRLARLPRPVLRRVFTEPHSTKPYRGRRALRLGHDATTIVDWAATAGVGSDVRDLRAPRALPDAGDPRRRRPARAVRQRARRSTTLVPGARMLTIGGGGHVTARARPGGLQPRAARLRGRRAAHARPGCAA